MDEGRIYTLMAEFWATFSCFKHSPDPTNIWQHIPVVLGTRPDEKYLVVNVLNIVHSSWLCLTTQL